VVKPELPALAQGVSRAGRRACQGPHGPWRVRHGPRRVCLRRL